MSLFHSHKSNRHRCILLIHHHRLNKALRCHKNQNKIIDEWVSQKRFHQTKAGLDFLLFAEAPSTRFLFP